MIGAALVRLGIGKVGDLVRLALRAPNNTISPAHHNHELAAVLIIREELDGFDECLRGFHDLRIGFFARSVKYVVAHLLHAMGRRDRIAVQLQRRGLVERSICQKAWCEEPKPLPRLRSDLGAASATSCGAWGKRLCIS